MAIVSIIIFICTGIYISIVDFLTHRIRNSILIKLAICFLGLALIRLIVDRNYLESARFRLEIFWMVTIFYLLLAACTGFKIGAGDLKYALLIAVFLDSTLPFSTIIEANQVAIVVTWSMTGGVAIKQLLSSAEPKAIPMAPALFLGALAGLVSTFH